MYSKFGKTKLFTWFFAFLTMLFIALVLVFQVGFTVDAKQISGGGESQTKGGGTTNGVAWSYDDQELENVTDIYSVNFSGLYNYADSNLNVIRSENSIDTYNSGVYHFLDSSNNDYSTVLNALKDFKLPSTFTFGSETYNISDFPNMVVYNEGSYYVMAVSDDTFYEHFMTSTSGAIGIHRLYNSSRCFIFPINVSNSTFYNIQQTAPKSDVLFFDGQGSYDGQLSETRNVSLVSDIGNIVYSNCSVFSLGYSYYDEWPNFRCNNLAYDIAYAISGDTNLDGGGNSGETSDNNLVMENADWIFNNSDYSPQQVIPSGNIIFTFEPTDYQKSHFNEFHLQYYFTFRSKCKYQWRNMASNPPFYKTSAITNNWKEFEGLYTYVGEVDTIPLSEFINNSNTTVFSWDDLFSNFQGGESVNSKMLSAILRIGIEADSLNFSTFDITCQAEIVTNSASSGNYTEVYNPITKSNRVQDDSGTINPNPYIEPQPSPDDEDSGTTPPEDTTTNTTTNKNGNINITIHNTNNGGGSSGSGNGVTTPTSESEASLFWKIFNPVKLFTNLLIDKNTSLGNEIVEGFGINTYISVIASTFAFMPVAFWTSIVGYISAVFKILIVAFIIRIVLDLL